MERINPSLLLLTVGPSAPTKERELQVPVLQVLPISDPPCAPGSRREDGGDGRRRRAVDLPGPGTSDVRSSQSAQPRRRSRMRSGGGACAGAAGPGEHDK